MNKLVEAVHLRKEYVSRKSLFSPKKIVKAVDYASFEVFENEIFGLVGGRGSGKTTLGELIAGLTIPDYGRVEFRGRDIGLARGKEKKKIRGRIRIVFQDVAGHLDGRLTVEEAMGQSIANCRRMKKETVPLEIEEALELAGLSASVASSRLRLLDDLRLKKVGIALAAICRPELIVLDEPAGGLDASVRGQVFEAVSSIESKLEVGCLFMSRDLNAACKICDRVAIIEDGRIVEIGKAESILENPRSEYARGFLESML